MAKGQITIPKDVHDVLGVSNGDRHHSGSAVSRTHRLKAGIIEKKAMFGKIRNSDKERQVLRLQTAISVDFLSELRYSMIIGGGSHD